MSKTDLLGRILQETRAELKKRKARLPAKRLQQRLARSKDQPRGFTAALQAAHGRPAVIAELKQASPSRGRICKRYRPADIAAAYERAGAHCLSVLTDTPFFQGRLTHLQKARAACALPVLRKDFILESYQVYESRLAGADCILLIAAVLRDKRMHTLARLAVDLGMDVLAEVHNREELQRVLQLDNCLVGINNRNLHDFVTHIQTTVSLLPLIPVGRTVVSESGICEPSQVNRLYTRGAAAFLVGEALLATGEPTRCLQRLFPPP